MRILIWKTESRVTAGNFSYLSNNNKKISKILKYGFESENQYLN